MSTVRNTSCRGGQAGGRARAYPDRPPNPAAAAVLLLLPVLDAVTGHGVPVSALVRAVVVA
ncbi:hypothetical protein, partial [Nocardia sp. NPDC024068]|uniref:hypothetical protein n=1 Tax=Nocardia sp. NPDC024068 TaxID=3157197 RepID=UPI0033E73DA2